MFNVKPREAKTFISQGDAADHLLHVLQYYKETYGIENLSDAEFRLSDQEIESLETMLQEADIIIFS